jgi:Rrf2 family iron-sulfur cluster assembly transcriptional regulator
MNNSSRARYAAAAVIDLACQAPARPTTLAAIAKRQNISVSYLEQLFARLRAAGVLRSVRGPGGGYVLARASQEITIADIYDAVLDRNGAKKDEENGEDIIHTNIKTEALWQAMDHQVLRFLKSVTVHDVILDKVIGSPARPN